MMNHNSQGNFLAITVWSGLVLYKLMSICGLLLWLNLVKSNLRGEPDCEQIRENGL